jgi:hypothetical protein
MRDRIDKNVTIWEANDEIGNENGMLIQRKGSKLFYKYFIIKYMQMIY